MRHLLLSMLCFTGICLTTSCGSDNNQTQENTETTASTDTIGTAVIGGDSTLTDDQRSLFEHIARHTSLQVELGKLAAQKGTSDAVKQYGTQMQEMYTTRQKELQEMAQSYNLTLNQEIDENYRDDVEAVTSAEKDKFDEKYWDTIIDAQQDLLKEYDDVLKEVDKSEPTAFYVWAQTSMKELRAQMEQAMANKAQLKATM